MALILGDVTRATIHWFRPLVVFGIATNAPLTFARIASRRRHLVVYVAIITKVCCSTTSRRIIAVGRAIAASST
jgi:hypothetical protein